MATLPLGVPDPDDGLTVVDTSINSPWVIVELDKVSVVVVGRNWIEFQLLTNTFASIDPKPLAWS